MSKTSWKIKELSNRENESTITNRKYDNFKNGDDYGQIRILFIFHHDWSHIFYYDWHKLNIIKR